MNEAMSDDELLEVYEEADKEKTESLTIDQLSKFYSARGVSAKFLMVVVFDFSHAYYEVSFGGTIACRIICS